LLSARFLKFSVVGTIGFVCDAGLLSIILATTNSGLLLARVWSFLFAATVTWALNRYFTFSETRNPARHKEWVRYVALTGIGGGVNYLTYAAAVLSLPLMASWPALAVALGSLVGLGFNYTTSRYLVFVHTER
jgi:putative flippase GtrA